MMYGSFTRHLMEQARAEGDKWLHEGWKAAMAGAPREVPQLISPAGETAWLTGYDRAKERMEDQR